MYVRLAERHAATGRSSATFVAVGNVPESPHVMVYEPMSQEALSAFYRSNVDVYVRQGHKRVL